MNPGRHDILIYIGSTFEQYYAVTTDLGLKADLRGSLIAAKIVDRLNVETVVDFEVVFTNAEKGEFKLCLDYTKTDQIKVREGRYDIIIIWPNDGGLDIREYLLQGSVYFDGGVSNSQDRIEYAATQYLPSWDFSST